MSGLSADSRRLRRVALQQQGLLRREPFGRGRSGASKAMQRLGYVQIDTISVVARAHHHVLAARVPGFKPRHLQQLLARGEIFEYWSHAAAFLPMEDFRFSLPRKRQYLEGKDHWGSGRNRKLMAHALQRIASEGPLRSRDFEQPAGGKTGWWDWKPAKQALEQLFMQGELMVAARDGFEKTYDLSQRVIPQHVDTSEPSPVELAEHLVESALQAHGFITQPTVTYQRKGGELRAGVRQVLLDGLDSGRLIELGRRSGTACFAMPELFESTLPRAGSEVKILSPFDNSIIQRKRTNAVYCFDYQIECYLPASRRRYGYFCLPLLFADRFVGRMDCKAHRTQRRLEIKHLHLEENFSADEGFALALARSLWQFACFNECDSVELCRATPPSIAAPLKRALHGQLDRTD